MTTCDATHGGYRCSRQSDGAGRQNHHGNHRTVLRDGTIVEWGNPSGQACPEGTCAACDGEARAYLEHVAAGGRPNPLSLQARRMRAGTMRAAEVKAWAQGQLRELAAEVA